VAKTVGDVMTSLPTALDARASVPDAARAMRDGDIADVLVTQDGLLVLHRLVTLLEGGIRPWCRRPGWPRRRIRG
jgi:CBS domain-containing protein